MICPAPMYVRTTYNVRERLFKLNFSQICLICIDRYIYIVYISVMKTTLNIDDQILRKASRLTGISEKTTLVRRGLEALIAQESAKRLAALGGSEKKLKSIPRRKSITE
jgi:Arc/MetJ family transcription regulator